MLFISDSNGILFGIGLFFIIECFIKKSFQWYLPLSGAFSSAGNVMKNYKEEVFNTILGGIPAILLFFLPLALYNIFQKSMKI